MLQDLINKIELVVYDNTIEPLSLFIDTYQPTTVFHLASLFIAEHNSNQVTNLIDSNILFGAHLLEAMQVAGVKRLINTSTCWQHYNNQEYNPVCLYAATKEAFEKIIDFYVKAYNYSVITLELFDTYGPGDPRKKIIPLFQKISFSGEQLFFSPGEQELDLVYLDDVIAAYEIADTLLKEATHLKYSVATKYPKRLKDIACIFEKIFQAKLDIVWGVNKYRAREVMKPWNKGIVLPGWQPRYNLEDGLKKIKEFSDRASLV